jgi:uridine kinase
MYKKTPIVEKLDNLKMKNLFKNPIFLTAILLKILVIFYFDISVLPNNLYIPFLLSSVENFTLNPWKYWVGENKSLSAFPYGYAMWIYFLPFVKLSKIFSLDFLIIYKIALLILDIFLLVIINKIFIKNKTYLTFVFFLSPISLLCIYFLGLNDILPILLLFVAFYFLRKNHFLYSGLFLATSISAKLSMIIAIPFFVIYFYNNRNLRSYFIQFCKGFSISFVILIVPYLFSNEALFMLSENSEMQKIFQLKFSIGNNINIYIIPLIYLLLVYFNATLKRINFELLIANIGLSFLLIVLFTQSPPGWLIWCLPFFAIYQKKKDSLTILMILVFSIFFTLNFFINDNTYYGFGTNIIGSYFENSSLNKIQSNFQTIFLGTGLILSLICWKKNILNNDFFRLTRRPFAMAVAGDSGAGKDRLMLTMVRLLGKNSVTLVSGDNYHLWERNESDWKFATHLNPAANNLEVFSKDIIDLISGKNITTTHYNHNTGKILNNNALNTNDFILFSGLHALYTPVLQECSDLKIFLEPDENLRKYFKIKRDILYRKHTKNKVLKNIKSRIKDSKKHILPQRKNADLIFSLQPITSLPLAKINNKIVTNNLKLKILTKVEIDTLKLKNLLIKKFKVCFEENYYENGYNSFTIYGKIDKKNIHYLASQMCPNAFEFLDVVPEWKSDLDGIMQIIVLLHINKMMKKNTI